MKIDNKILILGGTGFIGKHLYRYLKELGYPNVEKWGKNTSNMMDYLSLPTYSPDCTPDYIFNLVGYNGGIDLNTSATIELLYQNTTMNFNILRHFSKHTKTQKILSTVASCAYPSNSFHCTNDDKLNYRKENTFLTGWPDTTVEGHAWAKRNVQIMSNIVSRYTRTKCVCICPTTVYGPENHLDLGHVKVLESLVIKFLSAQKNKTDVTLFGTGKPLREFIFVKDLVKLLVQCMDKYEQHWEPLNLGTGQEYSIKDLAEKIAAKVGFSGNIIWDKSKPDGEYRKRLHLDKMHATLGDTEFTPFDVGLDETINWYREQLC